MFKAMTYVACVAFAAVPASAQSPLDGTWKTVIAKSTYAGKPMDITLAGGSYTCTSCEMPYTIKADGTYQKRPGIAVDESSVQIVSDRVVKTASRYRGQLTAESLVTVAPDNATRRIEFVEYSPNGTVSRGANTQRRVGPAPGGAHAVSGQWMMASADELSDSANVITFKTSGKEVELTTLDGYGYKATLGGPAVKVSGDPSNSMIQLSNPAPNVFVQTSSIDGKVRGVDTITINADGTATVRSENRVNGNTSQHQMTRQ